MSLDGLIRRLGGKSAPQPDVTPEQCIAGIAERLSAGDDAVLAWLDRLETAHPDDIAATHAARELIRLDRSDLAETWLAGWRQRHRGLWAERELAQLILHRGDRDAALTLYEALCETFTGNAIVFTDRIDILMHAGRLTEAAIVADSALPRFPADTWLWDKAAVLAERMGDPAAAYERWLTLRRFDPGHHRALAGQARILSRLRKRQALDRLMDGPEVELGVVPVDDRFYRVPADLSVTPTPLRRIVVIGSCLISGLPDVFRDEGRVATDFVLVNNTVELPEPPHGLDGYDFQFIQIPLRVILPDGAYLNLSYDQPDAWQTLFDDCCLRLNRLVANALAWNVSHGLPAFVANFIPPQQNALGRLMPRYDLRNFVYFIEQLNRHLVEEMAHYRNVWLTDIDQIAATVGRRFLQDDMVWVTGHGAILSNADFAMDQDRITALAPVQDHYPGHADIFCTLLWRELEAGFRSLQQIDTVKLVLIDLDDTLWRGVLAEAGTTEVEGWPLGLAEALLVLKRRGVLLGIVSKNSEDRVRELWPFEGLLPIDAFAVRRINWRPKADNITEILTEVNLLPKSVVFIDDNPAERAAVAAAFPDMRILGDNPYLLRRILLWSAETQGAGISDESARRSEMIQAQGERERSRKTLSREDFLASLQVAVALKPIRSTADPAFARAFELLNKTNQFNTTGVRWTAQEAEAFFARGGVFQALHVSDIYTRYGLTGVLCVDGQVITQFVMSCRVVGLEVELAAVALCVGELHGEVEALSTETDANRLSRDIWARSGFLLRGDGYILETESRPTLPAHIRIDA
ncbi:HAD-superfamily phosphatase, subfamily IIIC domain protein [Asticcacaulis biprosthecium C19]|uniref:HAD-superfamily phosphatase, subfamily IIIC domain protein n=1 Tax=Asticcacaulis biprosthecium C19 TaxID=715226 RepID=F4QJJ0_9CAUL|nr:HAD-IIIC family phosphatase [Asticcacaulis biprosthecium]EGF91941.1 HAD-superfamily phosphatase, subfamily IIIC domain protein [Asticcacaulis biprosthecium C19]